MDIKEIREKTGLSQSQFALKYGIPVRTLQQWEQGRSAPADYFLSLLEKSEYCGFEIKKYPVEVRKFWKICIENAFSNCSRIYPIQQRKVAAILKCIKDSGVAVNKVIVFGSSVTDRCRITSDVDFYLESDENRVPDFSKLDFEYDLWTNFNVDGRLKDEILKKGVVVYVAERNSL